MPVEAAPRANVHRMDRQTLRALARFRRALYELHALPPGSLPDELKDAIEDVVAPGFRERVLAAYLASLPATGPVQNPPLVQWKCAGSPRELESTWHCLPLIRPDTITYASTSGFDSTYILFY